MKKTLLLTLVLFTFLSKAQDKELIKINNPYYEIDSLAVYTEFKGDIPLLVNDITKNCTTPLEKTRAIFMWITENIAYDYKAANKKNIKVKFPKHKGKKDYGTIYAKWEDKFLKKIIKKEKAVCSGYSMLFKKMCDLAGLQSSIIAGNVRTHSRDIGKMGRNNHAWNTVLINGEYYYFDSTWGAGACDKNKKGKLLGFKKDRDYFYWCSPYDKLLIDHFPADQEWIRHKPYINAKEDYKNQPLYATSAIPYFKVVNPKSGLINAKVGDTIHFEIEIENYTGPFIMHTVTNLKPDEYTQTKFKRIDTILTFDYPIENKRIRELTIYSDGIEILTFKIKVQ